MNNLYQYSTTNYKGFLFDIALYIAVMFLIREVYFPKLHFIANGLMWSLSTLIVATWRMKARNLTWKDLGLRKPENLLITFFVTAGILAAIPLFIIIFKIIHGFLPFTLAPDMSSENAVLNFGDLKNNWVRFFTIIPFVLLQSALE